MVGLGVEPTEAELFAALVDPETGVCARESSFGEADVVTRIAAMSGTLPPGTRPGWWRAARHDTSARARSTKEQIVGG